MKKFRLATKIVIVILISFNRMQAQTIQTKLNQVELMMQFVGSWTCDIAKDTTFFWEVRSYGTGLEGNFRYVTKGKTIEEGIQLLGYDKKTDKCIDAELKKGKEIKIFAIWFISKNKCEIVLYRDVSNPEKASFREELEFKKPDIFLETIIVDNKPVKTYTFAKVKE